ncbi:TIGR03618 family F420-dependent PPOX class oxidoreductase [Actinomadura atramentaria]|uniref:TIGR03618 family F420-dependent PPOX class oxidoreductase n=1 Tax=Actinomadura atramentaria TaxID=1990 RepID=UPI00036AC694|nr:TIGR03618 family F420-dependent PPOX class oxidoreductase [Actinomadura atramentaria]
MTEYGAGRGPAAKPLDDAAIERVLRENPFGVLATLRRDGRPSLSTVVQNYDPAERVIRISTTEDRWKVAHLRRDPRTTLHVTAPDALTFVVVEAEAEVSAATAEPGDAVGRELLALQGGLDPAQEKEFLANMVEDRRLVIRLHVKRVHGTTLAGAD